MTTIYCNSSGIDKLLVEVNSGLNIGDSITLKI